MGNARTITLPAITAEDLDREEAALEKDRYRRANEGDTPGANRVKVKLAIVALARQALARPAHRFVIRADWQHGDLFFAGVTWHPLLGCNMHIANSWPPAGLTDGFKRHEIRLKYPRSEQGGG